MVNFVPELTEKSASLKSKSIYQTKSEMQQSQKSYGIPTIKLLNPELYKEMSKPDRLVKDPIFMSLKNIKERHTYLENRQQRIDKRNNEIARELKFRQEEQVRLKKLQMLSGN